MIFVVTGTQKFQFNRLLKTIDELVKSSVIRETVFAQRGNSDYIPQYYESVDFISKEDFKDKINEADIVITHAGVSTIISAIGANKPTIVMPRLSKYKEHVDDHQVDICEAFAESNYVIYCQNIDELSQLIVKSRGHSFNRYQSHRNEFKKVINDYLESISKSLKG